MFPSVSQNVMNWVELSYLQLNKWHNMKMYERYEWMHGWMDGWVGLQEVYSGWQLSNVCVCVQCIFKGLASHLFFILDLSEHSISTLNPCIYMRIVLNHQYCYCHQLWNWLSVDYLPCYPKVISRPVSYWAIYEAVVCETLRSQTWGLQLIVLSSCLVMHHYWQADSAQGGMTCRAPWTRSIFCTVYRSNRGKEYIETLTAEMTKETFSYCLYVS